MPDQPRQISEEDLQAFKDAYSAFAAADDAAAERQRLETAPITAAVFVEWTRAIQNQLNWIGWLVALLVVALVVPDVLAWARAWWP